MDIINQIEDLVFNKTPKGKTEQNAFLFKKLLKKCSVGLSVEFFTLNKSKNEKDALNRKLKTFMSLSNLKTKPMSNHDYKKKLTFNFFVL